MGNENPVLDNEKADQDVDFKPVTEQTPDRRHLFRKLLTLAGLGITGVLLSQDKTGLLPAVHATDMVIDAANGGVGTTTLSSITTSGSAFSVTAYSSDGSTTGIHGESDSTSGTGVTGLAYASQGNTIGVEGQSNSDGGIGVLGHAGTNGAIPIVARACTSTQSANLQEWQGIVSGNPKALSVVDANGNFGIGTSSPARSVHLVGHNANFRMDRDIDTAAFILVRTAAGNFNTIWKTFYVGVNASGVNNGSFFIGDNAVNTAGTLTTRLIIDNTGRVGLGRTPTANNLEVEGNASKATAGSWLANSDMRIKTEISDIDDALATIRKLHPVRFRYTDSYKAKHPSIKNHPYYNFIAQEYREVFPDSVQDDGEGLLQMDSHNTIPYLVRAMQQLSERDERNNVTIKEQQTQISKQQSTIETMKEQQEQFKNENEKLQERVVVLERTVKQFAAS